MNILQRNLLNINTLNKSSVATSTNIFGSKQPSITFNPLIKSTDIPKYYFINKFKSTKEPFIKKIKNDQRRLKNGEVDIDTEYEIKFILNSKGNEQNKLDSILTSTIGKTVPITACVRMKIIGNEELQYIVSDDYNGNHEVVVIDLYHMFFPSPDKSKGEKKANPKKKYLEHINDKHCLSEIIIDTQK